MMPYVSAIYFYCLVRPVIDTNIYGLARPCLHIPSLRYVDGMNPIYRSSTPYSVCLCHGSVRCGESPRFTQGEVQYVNLCVYSRLPLNRYPSVNALGYRLSGSIGCVGDYVT
jgi:hypothetical protein